MIFFLHGPDHYRAKVTIDSIKEKYRSAVDPSGHSIYTFDGESLDWSQLLNLLKGQGFFSHRNLIIIRDILSHPEWEEFEQPFLDWLALQKDTKDEHYLVLWQPQSKLPTKHPLIKALQRFKYVTEFSELAGDALERWVAAEAKKFNVSFTAEAIRLLIELVGTDTWELHNEIHKLCHCGHNPITLPVVQEFISGKITNQIFQAIDACGQRKKASAHDLIETLLRSGAEGLYILAMIARQFRLLAQVPTNIGLNNSYALASHLGVHPFVAKKLLQQTRNFSPDQLTGIYQALIASDNRLKLSANERATLALLIEKI
ncbi:MAG: DNA polymerase III subunit delta [Candidatus Komeilibacteria bacterium]